MRGYFGIGVYHPKTEENIGTLWRSAYQLGAAFIFTVGRRCRHQASDTTKAWRHIPLYEYSSMEELVAHAPHSCPLVAIETGGRELGNYCHPERCIYLLGAEDHGLPASVLMGCHLHITIPSVRHYSYNVAMAGTIVMYDRLMRRNDG